MPRHEPETVDRATAPRPDKFTHAESLTSEIWDIMKGHNVVDGLTALGFLAGHVLKQLPDNYKASGAATHIAALRRGNA